MENLEKNYSLQVRLVQSLIIKIHPPCVNAMNPVLLIILSICVLYITHFDSKPWWRGGGGSNLLTECPTFEHKCWVNTMVGCCVEKLNFVKPAIQNRAPKKEKRKHQKIM